VSLGRRPAGWRVLLGAACGLAALVATADVARAAPAAAGDRYRVVVLKPPTTDEITTGALARVRGELTAAGFDVREVPQDPSADVRDVLETVGRDLDPIATFAIVPGPSAGGGSAADIWVNDRLAGKSVIQTVHLAISATDPERAATVLAVQAVELLKASLAQYWIGPAALPRRPAPPPPPAKTGPPALEEPYVSAGFTAEAAVGRLDSVGVVGAVWEPIVRLAYGGQGGWAARASFGGLGSDTELRTTTGSAQLQQQVGTLEAVRSFRVAAHAQLFASAGTGVYHLRVVGTGTAPWQGTVTSAWAALVVAGAGLALPLGARFALLVEGQALVTFPSAMIRIDGAEVGRAGLPALLASAGLLGRF
jgi:hypothetical protein